jgi:hypothetical protein
MKPKNISEAIVDDNGVELVVDYAFTKERQQVEINGLSEAIITNVCTELKAVTLVLGTSEIDLLPFLSGQQQNYIISKLTYE